MRKTIDCYGHFIRPKDKLLGARGGFDCYTLKFRVTQEGWDKIMGCRPLKEAFSPNQLKRFNRADKDTISTIFSLEPGNYEETKHFKY